MTVATAARTSDSSSMIRMGIMPRPPDPLLLLRVQRSLPLKGSRLAEHFDVVDMAALQAHLRS
jgi:hypothetical protein